MMSREHVLYLKKIRNEKIFILFFRILIILILLFLWQFLADKGLINTFISSSPRLVVKTVIKLYLSNDLFNHVGITIYETFISFSLATILGIIIAIILWWYPLFAKVLDPYLTILNSLPKVALGPIIIIIVGANMKSIITMALFISLIITIMNVYEGFVNIDKDKIKLLKSFHATKIQLFTKLVLPGSFNVIVSALKINVSMTLIGVIMGEFLVSKKGIGYLIMYGSQVFNLNLVISGIIILAILATIMYYLVSYIEKKLIKY